MEGARRRGRPRRPLPEDPGRDPRAGEVGGPLEPVHARRALRPRAHQLGVRAALRGDGPQPRRGPDGLQLLGAGHRQHGDPRRARDRGAARALARPAARGTDPLLLLDDRARGLRLGPDAAAGARRPRRRRVGDRRPQVVHLGRRRRRPGDRDGRHRPRGPSLRPRLDDLRPDRQSRLQPGPADLGDGPRGRPRPLRDPLRRVPRPGRQPARRRGQGLRRRPGPPRPRPHPPLHARDRDRRAGAGDDVPPRQRRARRSAGRWARSSSSRRRSPSRGWRSTRPGC